MKKNVYIILSFLCLLYFSGLVYISYNHIILNNFLEAIFELFTIPFILLTITLFVVSLRNWHIEKWSFGSQYFKTLLILIATILLMIIATIYDI